MTKVLVRRYKKEIKTKFLITVVNILLQHLACIYKLTNKTLINSEKFINTKEILFLYNVYVRYRVNCCFYGLHISI